MVGVPHLDGDCLDTQIFRPLFRLCSPFRTPEMDLVVLPYLCLSSQWDHIEGICFFCSPLLICLYWRWVAGPDTPPPRLDEKMTVTKVHRLLGSLPLSMSWPGVKRKDGRSQHLLESFALAPLAFSTSAALAAFYLRLGKQKNEFELCLGFSRTPDPWKVSPLGRLALLFALWLLWTLWGSFEPSGAVAIGGLALSFGVLFNSMGVLL